MKKITFFFIVIFLSTFLTVQNCSAQSSSSIDYSSWERVLSAFVNDQGRVDYGSLKNNSDNLDPFITIVENTDVNTLSERDKKAFWINAYNAVTLKVVTEKYPKVKSIRTINFGLVWEKKREVAQGKYSLGHIEHKILRPQGDPRIHFALNCASIGCPELPNEPFYPIKLEEQLEKETRAFINNPEKVRLDRATNTLYYSAIFKWFEEDFYVVADDILGYIMKYINESDKTYLQENDVKMKVLKYDWGLNSQ